MSIKVYGHSDDLIEVEGDIDEEFCPNLYDPENYSFITVSDGSVWKIRYEDDGIWRIFSVVPGSSPFFIEQGAESDGDYSDARVLSDRVDWIVCGDGSERRG